MDLIQTFEIALMYLLGRKKVLGKSMCITRCFKTGCIFSFNISSPGTDNGIVVVGKENWEFSFAKVEKRTWCEKRRPNIPAVNMPKTKEYFEAQSLINLHPLKFLPRNCSPSSFSFLKPHHLTFARWCHYRKKSLVGNLIHFSKLLHLLDSQQSPLYSFGIKADNIRNDAC